MARTALWKSIATTLNAEIASGLYRAGDKLPTEATLAARFGVNRHTVRRGLGDLGERGVVRSRRGAGVFVEAPMAEYSIGRRVRFHQNIRATGRLPQKQVFRIEIRPADATEAEALAIAPAAAVLIYEGLSLANSVPVAHFHSLFPKDRLPKLAETFRSEASVTKALRLNGITDYTRAETRVSAERASPIRALHLGLREGDPLLRTDALNVDLDGVPIERGTTWFAGNRVVLTMTPE